MGTVRPLTPLALLAFVLSASAVSPVLNSITPPGVKAGADVELSFHGARLQDVQEVLTYSRGLQVMSLDARKTNVVKVVVKVSPDCPLGEHQMRLRALSGLSEVRTIHVGPFSVVKESEPNNEPEKAQVLPPNTTVSGILTAEDVDCFKVEGHRGRRLSVEVEGMRLGRVMLDPYLALLDPDGKQIAECDDSVFHLQDPVISLIAPKDGFYVVQLRESSWGGGNDFAYLLHVGDFPRPTVVYPLGGPGGAEAEVTFLGDPTGAIEQRVRLAPGPGGEAGVVAESAGVRAPSPNAYRISELPNLLESGANHDRAHAFLAPQPPPLAFNGVLAEPREEDWFGFHAAKKKALEISVFARRLRSPVDSVLQLVDASGKVLETNDDGAGPDSVIKFTPEEEGMYFLRIQDQLKGGGPDYVYRIEVRPPASEVVLNIPEVARNDSQTRQAITVPRGGRMATLIHARRTGVSGDLAFEVPGLPAGVTLQAEPMPQAIDTMPWVFSATADARLDGGLVSPVARLRSGDKPVATRYQHLLELIRGNNDQVYYGTRNDRLAVGVVQEVPFELRLEAPAVPLARSGSMKLKVSLQRRPGFDEPVNVKMLWNPPGLASETEVTIPKGKSTAEYAINAKGDSALGTWKLVLLGSAPYQGGTVHASSELTPVRVTEPFILGKINPVSTEPGKPVQVRCTLDQREPFEGRAVVRLVGLPEKATTAEREITKGDKEVAFDVSVDPKIPPGSHKNLACVIQIRKGEDTILQTVGSGGILRIVPPKKPGAEPRKGAASARPAEGAK